jgi:predicted P-loop ATPase
MVVLEGKQGIKKTKSLRAIGGKWYASVRATVGTPQFYSAIQGKLLCEIAELEGFSKAGIESIKEMLTSTTDRFRIPYDKYHADFDRSCIFVGSTNEEEYLTDMTGGRRFWPIKVGMVNYEKIEQDRAQLFAEALVKYQAGEKWYEFNPDEMREVQENRRINDPWEGLINEYLQQHESLGISMDEIFRDVLFIDVSKRGIVDQRRVGKILRFFGWKKKGRQTEKGYRIFWYPLCHETFANDDEPSY